jgi:hypothetical protein
MLRSIIPFVLICLGFTVVGLARDMPLFEWKISEIVADLPPNYYIKLSPWTTRLGESVLGDASDDNSYFLWQVYTPIGNNLCSPVGRKPVVKRPHTDEVLERVSIGFYQKIYPWLWGMSWLILFLSGLYVWWFAILYKRPISEPVIFTVLIVIMSCWLFDNVWRALAARVMPALSCVPFAEPHPYFGTITFSANLSKIHYEMLAALLIGVSLELGAVVVMLRQTMKAIMRRNESAQSAAG